MEPMPTMHPTQPEPMPLYYASLCCFVGLTEHLIAPHSPDINNRGASQTTPFHASLVKGHLKVPLLLLRNRAHPDSRDHLQRVLLHSVSQGAHLVIVKSSLDIAQLLINSGTDLNITDDEGCSPFHAPAQSTYLEIPKLLLGSNARLRARNKNQQTPLKLASANQFPRQERFHPITRSVAMGTC